MDPGLCLGSRLWSFIHSMFSLSALAAIYHQLQILSLCFIPFPHIVLEKIHEAYTSKHLSGGTQNPTVCSSSLLLLWFLLRDYWFTIDGGFPSWLSHMFLFQDWWSCKRNPENHLKFLFSAAIFHRCFGPLHSVKAISVMEQTHVI